MMAVSLHHIGSGTIFENFAVFDPDQALACVARRGQHMSDDEDGRAFVVQFENSPEATLLEFGIANGQNFIDQNNVRIDVQRHAARQPRIHPGRVVFHRLVQKFPQPGKLDDAFEAFVNILAGHAHHDAVVKNVFHAAEFGMKPDPQFEHRGNSPARAHRAGSRLHNTSGQLEHRGFTRAICSQNAEHLPARNIERHIVQGVERFAAQVLEQFVHRPRPEPRRGAFLDVVRFGDVAEFDGVNGGHSLFESWGFGVFDERHEAHVHQILDQEIVGASYPAAQFLAVLGKRRKVRLAFGGDQNTARGQLLQ